MPDRASRIDMLRAATPVRIGPVSLLPIERVMLDAGRCAPAPMAWVSAALEPYAVIVRDALGIRVIDVGAGAVSLEQLRERIPGLDAMLKRA